MYNLNSLEYMAGFFDGEGCIHISKRQRGQSHRLQVTINQVSILPLGPFIATFGGKLYTLKKSHIYKNGRFQWGLYGRNAIPLLEKLLPHLLLKKAQAEIALDFLSHVSDGKASEVESFELEMQARIYSIFKAVTLKQQEDWNVPF